MLCAHAYDVLGRRAAVTYDNAGPLDALHDFQRVSVYDGSQVVWTERGTSREQVASTTTQALLWAPGIDQLLAIQETLGGLLETDPIWTLPDHQGTVKDYLAKATAAGAGSGLVLTRRYSAFGEPESATRWSNGPEGYFTDNLGSSGFFYVGQEYDATTGLQYSRARYYDPVSSEFISQDPLGFAGGDTNLYRRAGNSPANATDPSGLAVFLLAIPPVLSAAKVALAYAGVQASFALGESAIEVGATWWAGGEVSAGSAAETFGKNFAINVATGGIGTKAKLASRVGLYALRQGIEIGGDTAFDVGWRGQDFRSSLAINTAGSLIGEAAGRVAIAGARRSLGRGFSADLPELPSGYHYRTVGGRSVVARNPGRAGDLPQMHLDGNVLKSGPVPRRTGGYWDWANVRQRLGASGWAESGQDLHHWMIPRNGWGKTVPDVIKNQKWNLMRMPSRSEHFRVHGWSFDGQPGYNLPTRLWRGTPTPAKLTISGGIVVVGAGYYYFSE